MLRTGLIWGVIAGLIMVSIWWIGSLLGDPTAMDSSTAMLLGFGTMILAFGASYFGVRKAREQAGSWSFMKAWGTGLLIVAVGSVIYVLGWVQYSSSHPGVMDGYFDNYTEDIRLQYEGDEAGLSAKLEEVEEMREMYRNNHPISWVYTFMEPLPVGVLLSLIIALILRKPVRPAES